MSVITEKYKYPDQTTKDYSYLGDSASSFTINITDDYYPNLTFDFDVGRPDYKFNEGQLLREFEEYVKATYNTHYSEEKFQATEFIIDGGHGTGFCIGNILKYAQRYGKKGSYQDARKDLLKVMHYALIQLHVHDLHAQPDNPESSNQHTSDNEDTD